jgi:hypothetical protein
MDEELVYNITLWYGQQVRGFPQLIFIFLDDAGKKKRMRKLHILHYFMV